MDAASIGYARCREVTRANGKSFYFASMALPLERKLAAYAIYSFLRRLDDMIDESAETDRAARLKDARKLVELLFDGIVPAGNPELVALRDTTIRFQLERQPFRDMLDGMQMDLDDTDYVSGADLDLYCYRVAGTVGLMIAPVFGARDRAAAQPAAALGQAMQLTNILRDIAEDRGRGRVYLARADMQRFGVVAADLVKATPAVAALIAFYVHRARGLYAEALHGVHYLDGFFSRVCVRMMAGIYGDILHVIEKREYDVFSSRAVVPTWRKLWLAVKAVVQELRS